MVMYNQLPQGMNLPRLGAQQQAQQQNAQQQQPAVGMTGSPSTGATGVAYGQRPQQAQGLGQMANQQQTQAFKKGGSPSHVMAHFNKKELKVLEDLQGGPQRDKKTGLATIDLSHAFNNHHVMDHVKKHVVHHLSTGGLAHEASEGRFGDNTLASVDKHTSDALNYLQGGSTSNPETGYDEHFGLSSILSGLSSVAKSAMPYIKKYGAQAVGMLGGSGGGGGGEEPQQQRAPSPFAGMDTGAKQKFYDEYSAQKSGQPVAPKPAPAPDSEGGGMPSWMSGIGDMMSGKQSPMDAFKNFGKSALQEHGSKLPSWMQGAAQTGMDMMGGKNSMEALKQYGSGMLQQHGSQLPSWAQGAAQGGMDMLNGQNPRQAAAQYGNKMMNQYGGQLPAWAQKGAKSAMNVMQGADPQEEAMSYGRGMMG